MKKEIEKIINYLSNTYQDIIDPDGKNYIDINLGKIAEYLGFSQLKTQFNTTSVIVPIKHHLDGMKVLIDGRIFVKYSQFDSGIAVPEYVANNSGLPNKPYTCHESMVLNFA
jgi:hypothetical protein